MQTNHNLILNKYITVTIVFKNKKDIPILMITIVMPIIITHVQCTSRTSHYL